MPKRPSNAVEGPPHKRAKNEANPTTAATAAAAELVLLKHADELVDCLQHLKRGTKSRTAVTLKTLCRTLLPAFTELATCADEDETRGGGGSQAKPVPPEAEAQGIQVPTFALLTPWKPMKLLSPYPALPPVPDPALEKLAFTGPHVSADVKANYDRLEWLGDAYLYLFATSFIYQTFPTLSAGRSSQIRELLVKNSTLAGYGKQYNFLQRSGATSGVIDKASQTKYIADLVESYTGAVILSDATHGLERAAEWLKTLWSITLHDRIRKEFGEREKPVISEPKVVLANLIKVPGVQIRYVELPSNRRDPVSGFSMMAVGVHVDGWGVADERLGVGFALKKQEAGDRAATVALASKKALKRWIKWKQDYVGVKAAEASDDDV